MADGSPGLIDKPGVYDLSMGVYHGQPCSRPSISASGLKTIHQHGLGRFWRTSPLNPQARSEAGSASLTLGTNAHIYIFEPDRAETLFEINGVENYRTKAARQWRDETIAAGRIPLTDGEALELHCMREAVLEHSMARAAVKQGRSERSLIWSDGEGEDQIWLKSRPDFMPRRSGQLIVDYKTTSSDLDWWPSDAIKKWRYDIQAALQIEGVRRAAEMEPRGLLYIVQSTAAPYDIRLFTIDLKGDDDWGRALIKRGSLHAQAAMEKFRRGVRTGDWSDPDFKPTIKRFGDALPARALDLIDMEVRDG